jgi:hypothetical protein
MTEHKELVDRLRKIETGSITENGEFSVNWCRNPDGHEAARVIEEQAAEIERLREALTKIAESRITIKFGDVSEAHETHANIIARKALTHPPETGS